MEITTNAYHIKVNKCCASCLHKECLLDGSRMCQRVQVVVEQNFICCHWQMSDGLKNAGLQNGGVVRERGTKEIIIR